MHSEREKSRRSAHLVVDWCACTIAACEHIYYIVSQL